MEINGHFSEWKRIECRLPQETMLGPGWLKFFMSDPEEVEQSENFRTADHSKPFQIGTWKGEGSGGGGNTWRKVESGRYLSTGKCNMTHSDRNNPHAGVGFQAIGFDPGRESGSYRRLFPKGSGLKCCDQDSWQRHGQKQDSTWKPKKSALL